MLLILILGAGMLVSRLQSIEFAAVGASRALAFECRVRPWACRADQPDGALQNELRRRHFGHPDREILSGDGFAERPTDGELHPFWRGGRRAPRLTDPMAVALSFEHPSFDAGLNTAAGAGSTEAVRLLSSLAGPNRFGLDARSGLSVAKIQVPVTAELPEGLANPGQALLPLRLNARTAMLADAWNAASARGAQSDSVESRVRQGSRLDNFRESTIELGYALTRASIDLMGTVGLEPAANQFRPYQPDVRVVPADRVQR